LKGEAGELTWAAFPNGWPLPSKIWRAPSVFAPWWSAHVRTLDIEDRRMLEYLIADAEAVALRNVQALVNELLPETALGRALDIPPNRQPVLADAIDALAGLALRYGRADHWSLARSQQLIPGCLFNAVRQPESE
jgi:hypothetical protein